MDTNGDLGIMSHVGHLRNAGICQRIDENVFLDEKCWTKNVFLRSVNSVKCPQMSRKCPSLDVFSEENGLWIMEFSG